MSEPDLHIEQIVAVSLGMAESPSGETVPTCRLHHANGRTTFAVLEDGRWQGQSVEWTDGEGKTWIAEIEADFGTTDDLLELARDLVEPGETPDWNLN
jgi:hypothetical protein